MSDFMLRVNLRVLAGEVLSCPILAQRPTTVKRDKRSVERMSEDNLSFKFFTAGFHFVVGHDPREQEDSSARQCQSNPTCCSQGVSLLP